MELNERKKTTFDERHTELIWRNIKRDRKGEKTTLSHRGNVDKVLDTPPTIAPRAATTPHLSMIGITNNF